MPTKEESSALRAPDGIEAGDEIPYEREELEEDHVGIKGLRGSTMLLFFFWLLCIIFRNAKSAVNFAEDYTSSICEGADDEECLVFTVIYRISIAVIVVIVLQALLAGLWSVSFFDKYWTVKFPFVILLSFALLYPQSVTFNNDTYVLIARIAAFAFICLQSVLFLDWAYSLSASLVREAMSGGAVGAAATRTFENTVGSDVAMARKSFKLIGVIIFAMLSLGVLITTMSLLYQYFGGEGCDENTTIITIGFVGCIAATIIQITASSNGSILTSSVISLYVAYLTYTSVSLNPRTECNSSLANNAEEGMYGVGPMAIGIILSFVSFAYVVYFTSRSITKFLSEDLPLRNLLNVVLLGNTSGTKYSITGTKLDFEAKLRSILLYLSVVLVLLVFYESMIFTNWGNIASDNAVITSVSAGIVSMYMNAVGAWITIGLYLVALLIPRWGDCLPNSVWDLKPRM
jgi:hypothetical protein